jgi:hypothetical protein
MISLRHGMSPHSVTSVSQNTCLKNILSSRSWPFCHRYLRMQLMVFVRGLPRHRGRAGHEPHHRGTTASSFSNCLQLLEGSTLEMGGLEGKQKRKQAPDLSDFMASHDAVDLWSALAKRARQSLLFIWPIAGTWFSTLKQQLMKSAHDEIGLPGAVLSLEIVSLYSVSSNKVWGDYDNMKRLQLHLFGVRGSYSCSSWPKLNSRSGCFNFWTVSMVYCTSPRAQNITRIQKTSVLKPHSTAITFGQVPQPDQPTKCTIHYCLFS